MQMERSFKNLKYDWFGFSHTCFPGISGRFLFLHTKKFHISNYYYFDDNSLECLFSIHSLQGSLLQIFALQVSPLTCPLSKCFSLQNFSPNSTISCDPWSSLTRLTRMESISVTHDLATWRQCKALGKEAESSKGPRVLSEGFTLAWCGCTFPWLFGPLDRCHTTDLQPCQLFCKFSASPTSFITAPGVLDNGKGYGWGDVG